MTKRELAGTYLYELHNAANHVDQNAQIATHNLESDPKYALEALERARQSAGRVEMWFDDAIRAVKDLIANPDRTEAT